MLLYYLMLLLPDFILQLNQALLAYAVRCALDTLADSSRVPRIPDTRESLPIQLGLGEAQLISTCSPGRREGQDLNLASDPGPSCGDQPFESSWRCR